jgi:hypothetical protein
MIIVDTTVWEKQRGRPLSVPRLLRAAADPRGRLSLKTLALRTVIL